MIILVITFFIAVLSFQMFDVSMKMNAINRVVMNTPIEIFETSVVLITNQETPDLYFNKGTLETKLNKYFAWNLSGYTEDYEVSYYYYVIEDHSYCSSGKCKGVDVRVETPIAFSGLYVRTMYYEIRGRGS